MTDLRQSILIQGREIKDGAPAYIIAELSANHNHSFDRAVALLERAKEAGADAVKLQTYTPETMTLDSDREPFRVRGTIWDGRSLFELYQEAHMPWEWQPELKRKADAMGLHLFSTPFDDSAVDFLEGIDVPAYKIASFELVDVPLLRRVARTGRPVILSTGIASLQEIEEAVATLRAAGCEQLALLKCTSAYPALPEDMNLKTIPDLGERFHVPVGLSDHSLEVAVPVAAVVLGACIVEKHLTLSRSEPGPDSQFSLEPQEFAAMVTAVRTAQGAMGSVSYGGTDGERSTRTFRRSIFVTEDVRAGEAFTVANIRVIRPGGGLHPRHYDQIIGQAAVRDLKRGTPLEWDAVSAGFVE